MIKVKISKSVLIVWVVCAVIIIGLLVSKYVTIPAHQEEIRAYYTLTVTKTESIPRKEIPGYFYLIYGYDVDGIYHTYMLDDHNYEVNDRPERHNTSDWYGAIEVGETYTGIIIGERIPLLSQYPNIVSVDGLAVADNGEISWK
jgi:hypothetical protein